VQEKAGGEVVHTSSRPYATALWRSKLHEAIIYHISDAAQH